MRYDDNRAVDLLVQMLKHLDQIAEAPQVDARLRLVKDRQLGAPGHDHGDLDTLELSAGQRCVHLPVDVVLGTQPHLGQIAARLRHPDLLARGQGDQVLHRQALEADRLLEGKADPLLGPLGDVQPGDILPVQQDAPLSGGQDARNDLGQSGLSSAVGPCDSHEPLVDGQADVPQDVLAVAVLLHAIADVL